MQFKRFIHKFKLYKTPYRYNHFTGQQQIVEYLKQGKCIASAAGRAKDIFTGKTINEELTFMTDGKYEWRSDIAYYVEKYNLRLSKDFEDYVLKKRKN